MSISIKNLVFEGGGVKGIAYAGAIEALEEAQILQQTDRVAGTSAGAIIATLVSLRYNASEIKSIIQQLDLSSFEDGWDPLRILTSYGLYKGDKFLQWLKEHISKKGLSEDATFKDFKDAGKRGLHVFATDLNMHNAKEFSVETTPDVIVAEAVRASMSIPLFFKAWKFSNNNPDDHIYVDGGTVLNYPIDTFDIKGKTNPETIGFHLDNLTGTPVANDLKYDELLKYVKNLFDTILMSQVIDFDKNPTELNRTVKINDFGISATDFNITNAQKMELYNSGKENTNKYLNTHGIKVPVL